MRILFVSSEIVPFASTGGLGDVSASLPVALAQLGIKVIRVMPLYQRIVDGAFPIKKTPIKCVVPMSSSDKEAEIWMLKENLVNTYFIGNAEYFDRSELYSNADGDYADNLQRFVFFQKAVVKMLDGLDEPIDLLHLNDWQTGLIPLYLKHGVDGLGREGRERTLFTIHNLAYQGLFPGEYFDETQLPQDCFSINQLEFYGQISSIKGGVLCSDLVTTVSKTYAEEIKTPELGCGLDQVMSSLGDRLSGIVNGVDYTIWNPEIDSYIPKNYSQKKLQGKQICKKDLLKRIGINPDTDRPLIGMVTRLSEQKGLNVLDETMSELMKLEVNLVLLGSGGG